METTGNSAENLIFNMVKKESLWPISNSSDHQGCSSGCGDLRLQLKPALNLKETEDKTSCPQKDTDAGDFCTRASTTVHVLAQSVVCLHCSHALVLTWLSEARQPSCSQYHEISPHPQGKLPALLKVAFNRLLKKKIIYLAASRLQDL